jgi:hypothetical protein
MGGHPGSEQMQKRPLRVKRGLTPETAQQVGVDLTTVLLAEFTVKMRVYQLHGRVAVVHGAADILPTMGREKISAAEAHEPAAMAEGTRYATAWA